MSNLSNGFKYLTIIFFAFTIFGCDESVEVSKIELTKEEKKIFPYSKDQKIEFEHSNGYQFHLIVSNVNYKFQRYYETPTECLFCGNSGNYVLYEMKYIKLNSDYPKLVIEINYGALSYPFLESGDSTLSTKGKPLSDKIDKRLSITVNGFYTYDNIFDKNLNYSCSNEGIKCYESIVINKTTYYNVVELDAYYYNDSIYSSVKSVLYNEKGLLQIKLSKDESYSIK